MNDDKYVLFLDILGFGQLVENNTSTQLKQIYDSEIHQTAGMCTSLAATTFKESQNFEIISTKSGKLVDVRQKEINFHVMSDSIIAWTNDTEEYSLIKLCQFAATYLSMTFILGLPHRGGISKGSLFKIQLPLNGNVQTNVTGTGLVNAHRLEGAQEWMGCVVDPNCITDGINKLVEDPSFPITNYDIPYKKDKKLSSFAINWTLFNVGLSDEFEFYKKQFERHNKGYSDSTNVKTENTYKFYLAKRTNKT